MTFPALHVLPRPTNGDKLPRPFHGRTGDYWAGIVTIVRYLEQRFTYTVTSIVGNHRRFEPMLEITSFEADRRLRGSLLLAGAMIALIVLTVALFPSIQETGADLDAYLESLPPGDSGVRRKCDDANDDRGLPRLPALPVRVGVVARDLLRIRRSLDGRGRGRTRDGGTDTVVAGDADTSGGWQIPVARSGSRSRERDHVPRGRSRRGIRRRIDRRHPTCSPFTRTRSSTCSPAPASDSWLRSRSIPSVEHRPSGRFSLRFCSCSIPSFDTDYEWLGNVAFSRYFDPGAILVDGEISWSDISVLLIAVVVLVVVSGVLRTARSLRVTHRGPSI